MRQYECINLKNELKFVKNISYNKKESYPITEMGIAKLNRGFDCFVIKIKNIEFRFVNNDIVNEIKMRTKFVGDNKTETMSIVSDLITLPYISENIGKNLDCGEDIKLIY